MKSKFFLLTFLLLFSRGCDFYSTSLWFFDNPTDEQNLLYRVFGFGWTGLVVSNIILIGLIIYCFYYYTYRYRIGNVVTKPNKLTDYVSERYYGRTGLFFQVFYKTPSNKMTLLGHSGYVLIRVLIVGSILAAIHNLCQFYNVPIYNTFRKIVGRPLFIIYGLIFLSLIFFQYRLWSKEYKTAIMMFDANNKDDTLMKNAK